MPFPKQRYQLAPHMHRCRVGNIVVLLDLKGDRYLGLSATDATMLDHWIEDWPGADPRLAIGSSFDERGGNLDVLREMLHAGMLTDDVTADGRTEPDNLPPPRTALIDGYVTIHMPISPRHVGYFIASALTSYVLLRWRSLEKAAMRVARRSDKWRRACVEASALTDAQIERLRQLVATFRRMRPLLYTARDACLFESLMLSEYLAHHGLFPRWVFGVATDPFAAHCWLQHNEIVVNDSPENARRYTPIMVL